MSQLLLYEGTVSGVQVSQKWITLYTKEHRKPVAYPKYEGTFPKVGEKISVEASEGDYWWFARHRDAAIKTPEGSYDLNGLANFDGDRNAVVEALILKQLSKSPTVCSDDIIDQACARFPGVDPRFIGHGFRMLAKRKRIHKVGMKKSNGTKNHARDIAIWELTRTGELLPPRSQSSNGSPPATPPEAR